MTRLLNLFFGLGYLYLIRSGSRYKIGIGIDAERRFRQVDESIPGSREHLVGCVRAAYYLGPAGSHGCKDIFF